jgi:transcriptional regulator with XRE-family HTH domain
LNKNRYLKIGLFLRKKRLKAKMTQGQLAKCLKYTPQFIANWERGASNPPALVMSEIAKLLKISKSELLTQLVLDSKSYWESILNTKENSKNPSKDKSIISKDKKSLERDFI